MFGLLRLVLPARRCAVGLRRLAGPYSRAITSSTTTIIALVLKAIIIPLALRRMVVRLGIRPHHRDGGRRRPDDACRHGSRRPLHGGACCALPRPPTRWRARTSPSRCPWSALGLLMMVTRRNAVSQIIGFMSLEQPPLLDAPGHAAGGGDQHRLLCPGRLHRHRRVPVPHPRAFRVVDVSALDAFRGERR